MRQMIRAGLVLLFAAAVAHADGKVEWMTDHDAALKKAKESGKLLHVHFQAEWCVSWIGSAIPTPTDLWNLPPVDRRCWNVSPRC